MPLAPGLRLGAYEIQGLLGVGGMGEVYKATDTRLDRTVAIKTLPEHVATNPDLKQRFEREAKALAALSHPHICPVFDVGSQDGTDFFVIEYLEGETLEERLTKGAFHLQQALQIGVQIAEALAAAHHSGIVHRDLKPSNVMLTKSGAKLLDFGLAKSDVRTVAGSLSRLPTSPPNLTAQGTILGTLQYMAPEQLEGQEADTRTDIFAFGALFYEMSTGRKAFEGKSQASLIAAILEREPPALSTLQPLTPPHLDHVVARCLAKDPETRWQSASDVMGELKWIAAARPHTSASVQVATRRSPSERIAWLFAAVLAVISAMAIAFAGVRTRAPSAREMRVDIVTPPTPFPSDFALSPDARWLAFVATADDRPQLWLRSLENGATDVLKGTALARSPFWSPDSRSVGFMVGNNLKRLDLSDRSIRDFPVDVGVGVGITASWNHDDVILFARTIVGPIRRFSAVTHDKPLDVTRLAAGESGHVIPHFLPDGRHYLYQVFGTPEVRGVYIGALDGGEPKRLLDADGGAVVASDHVLFVRQGALLGQAFDSSRLAVTGEPFRVADGLGDPNRQFNLGAVSTSTTGPVAFRARQVGRAPELIWFDRQGREVGRIADAGTYRNPALSADGRRLAVSRVVNDNEDVWTFDTIRGGWTRATTDKATDTQPVVSADGRRVAFFSTREGSRNLYVKSADGSGDDDLVLVMHGANSLSAWSPDSRLLVVDSPEGMLAVPVDRTGAPARVVPASAGPFASNADVSPDGKWIVYESRGSGRSEIYAEPFLRPGARIPITTTGGAQVRWRGDGKEIFYMALDGRMMAVPVRFGPDDQSLNLGEPVPLFSTRTPGGVVQSGGNRQQYVVSPDGSRFLVSTDIAESAAAPPITLILNWQPDRGAR